MSPLLPLVVNAAGDMLQERFDPGFERDGDGSCGRLSAAPNFGHLSTHVSEIASQAVVARSAQEQPASPAAADDSYETVGDITVAKPVMRARHVDVYYADNHAIKDVSLDVGLNEVIALIGPSGCGKSTLLRIFNRMYDLYPGQRATGQLMLDQTNILDPRLDLNLLRARVGMVFQKPSPFPKSVYDNVAYGPRIHGLARNRVELDDIVETSLERAGLWSEVKDRLEESGMALSGGQQQRLCIARTIAIDPEVILMDEPCSALDPIATARIEDLLDELKQNYAIAIVTHSMQQAARVSQRTAYFHFGKLIEVGDTDDIFTNPRHKLTEDYITGRFG